MSHLSSSKSLFLCFTSIYSPSKRRYYWISLKLFNLDCLNHMGGWLSRYTTYLQLCWFGHCWNQSWIRFYWFYSTDTLKSQKFILLREDSHRNTCFRSGIPSRHFKTTQPVYYKHTSLSTCFYYNLIISLGISRGKSLHFIIVQNCLIYFCSYSFSDAFSIKMLNSMRKKSIGILIGTALKVYLNLRRTDILTI